MTSMLLWLLLVILNIAIFSDGLIYIHRHDDMMIFNPILSGGGVHIIPLLY